MSTEDLLYLPFSIYWLYTRVLSVTMYTHMPKDTNLICNKQKKVTFRHLFSYMYVD